MPRSTSLPAALLVGSIVGLACDREYTTLPPPLAATSPEVVVEVEIDALPRSGYEDGWAPVDPAVWGVGADAPLREGCTTEPGELPQLTIAGGSKRAALRHTDVVAHLRGTIAEVVVTQRFVNDTRAAIEAVYTFPLPENSAVADMRMVIGARIIEAEIQEREQALATFAAARRAGHTAALLEQERPNIFTQSVTNIPAGAEIEVEIRYLQTLSVDAGEVEFVFPTVVGPRFIPGAPLAGPQRGHGTKADTDRVADASRISPPIAGAGERSGHDLSIEVIAEGTAPITRWIAPLHQVTELARGPRLHVKLAERDAIPNRDFLLRYRTAGARPQAALTLGPIDDAGEGAFMLVAEPPVVDVDALVGRREFIFVIDVSGSMSGPPLALAKSTMRAALATMRPVDTFDLITFAGTTGRLWGAPRPANQSNLQVAIDHLNRVSAGGGTMMADAVDQALRAPVEDGRDRHVFFLTDGYIGNEDEIQRGAAALLAAQRSAGRRAHVFGVGVGSSPNAHLIAALSRAGEGAPLYAHEAADVARIVDTFQRYTDGVILEDLALAWGDLKVHDTYPAAAPTLFAGHPLVLHGRYSGPPPKSLTLRGRADGKTVTIPVAVTLASERGDVLTALWARAMIGDLELAHALAESEAALASAARAIVDAGLRYHLVTAFTSLIAVDRSRVVSDGQPTPEVVPVEVPVGVDPALAGAMLRTESALSTRVSMSQARMIPVGGTSRDFTAVVDLSPVASVDAAEVRLAGAATGATATGAPVAPEFIEGGVGSYGGGGRISRTWTGARVEVGAIQPVGGALRGPGAQAAIAGGTAPLARCFVADPRSKARRRSMTLLLRYDRSGALAEVKLRGASLSTELAACVRAAIDGLVTPWASAGMSVEVPLRVTMKR